MYTQEIIDTLASLDNEDFITFSIDYCGESLHNILVHEMYNDYFLASHEDGNTTKIFYTSITNIYNVED